MVLLSTCVVPVAVSAQGPSTGHGARGGWSEGSMLGVPLHSLNLTPDQQTQVRSILSASRASAKPLIAQIRQAQSDLADKLAATGSVQAGDIQPQLQLISQLRGQLLQNSAQTTLQLRALLTADQLAKAAQVKDQLRQLRAQMQQLLNPATQ
jgi:Spy/CpxP family protein refolding chaperone